MSRLKHIYFWASIGIISYSHAFDLTGTSFFMPRSHSSNAVTEIAGIHRYINRPNTQSPYGLVAATPAFSHSTRSERIAQALFGYENLTISGSQVTSRGANDILADYFGLAPTYLSDVCVDPSIRSALIDFQAYVGWDAWYLRLHAPAVWTEWDLGLHETPHGSASDFPAGYMDLGAITPPADTFTNALRGNITFGDMDTPLTHGKVCGKQSETGLSEIQGALGWNWINKPHAHAGFELRFGIPTGTRPTGEYLFEPVVGNGKHPELGLGFSGHSRVWEKDGTQDLSFFLTINMIHQFASTQCRSFDFCATTTDNTCTSCDASCCAHNFGSRYMLLKEFDAAQNYTGKLVPAINVSTVSADISVDFQMDFVAMFGYTYNNFVFDFGYNGWVRTKEKASIKGTLADRTYGFKGIQDIAAPDTQATQSSATLHGNLLTDQALVADTVSPQFVPALNPNSAQSQKMLTHKIFAYCGYDVANHSRDQQQLIPSIGIGGDVEFEGSNPRNQEHPHNTTLNQWRLWITGGLAY